jgi:hypothetical protein
MPVKKKPGEKIYEDDPRYEQDKFEGAVRTWRDRLKRKAPEGGVAPRPEKKVKDDVYAPPQKTVVDAVEKWKDRKAPPLRLRPAVGPVGDAKQSTAVRYNLTDEAGDMLRATHVDMRPPRETDNRGGGYFPDTGRIDVMAHPGHERTGGSQTLAHEFGHKWYFEKLSEQQRQDYLKNQQQWANTGAVVPNVAINQFNVDQATSDIYDDDAFSRPTETHARIMERSPMLYNGSISPNNIGYQNASVGEHPRIPGNMQPYFRGLLRGVPDPYPRPNPDPSGKAMLNPDDNGLYGAPPVKQWENYW